MLERAEDIKYASLNEANTVEALKDWIREYLL